MCRRAFTLIELLAAVAIIGALLALLLPSIAGASASARASVCLAHIRQLQTGNDLYSAAHKGHYCPGAPDIAGTNLVRWHGARASTGLPFDPARGPLTMFIDGDAPSRALRDCPQFAPTLEALEADASPASGFERGCAGYGYNNAFVGVVRAPADTTGAAQVITDQSGQRATAFRDPARTIAFTDAAFAADRLIEYSFAEPRFWPEFPGARPDPSIHFRHRARASVVWLDGHAGAEERTFTQASGLYSADPASLDIGWLGADDDNSLFDER